MDKKDQFKFQWSSAKSSGQILVIRGDNWTEFKADVEIGKIWLNNEDKQEPEEEVRTVSSLDKKEEFVDHTKGSEFCEIHEITMKLRKGKDGAEFYSHSQQLSDGSWDYCSGRGFRSQWRKE